jgi:phosphotransferase system IIA component
MPGQWQTQIRWMAPDGTPVHRGDKLLELDFSALAANALDQKGVAIRARSEIEGQRFKNQDDLETSEMDLETAQNALDKASIAAAVPPELLSRRDYGQRQLD